MDSNKIDFNDFYKRTYHIMMSYCRYRQQKKEDAEEIVNEAYSRMWGKWDECSEMSENELKKWLYSAIEYIIKERKKMNRVPTVDLDTFIYQLTNDVDDEIAGSFEDMMYEEYINEFHKLLTAKEKRLFDLIVIEKHTYAEAAAELCISENALRARLVRLRRKLSQDVEKIFK